MGISGVSFFHPVQRKTVKSRKNGVRVRDVRQKFDRNNDTVFPKMQWIFKYRNVIL